jgi:hypothetical protein
VLFSRVKEPVCFDEFQNFSFVDPSVYGALQKAMDLNENHPGLLLFSGSMVGMIKKLFSGEKEPLYGRVKRKMRLNPMKFADSLKMCRELRLGMEDAIRLYSIFGGFPKYYVAIEDENLSGSSFDQIMDHFFFRESALLEDEVMEILFMEFGKRTGVYYDIISSVANGGTRISEIGSQTKKKESAISRQLDELVNYFEIIGIEKQAIGSKKLFFIRHPLVNFWFRFLHRRLSLYKRREPSLKEEIKAGLNSYFGIGFEIVCREFLEEINSSGKLPFRFSSIGRQWGKFHGEAGKDSYEIDIVATEEKAKEILFCECKWKENVNAGEVLAELRKKASHVQWNNGKRKEHYCIIAKSFPGKKPDGCALFDLKDIEKALSD